MLAIWLVIARTAREEAIGTMAALVVANDLLVRAMLLIVRWKYVHVSPFTDYEFY